MAGFDQPPGCACSIDKRRSSPRPGGVGSVPSVTSCSRRWGNGCGIATGRSCRWRRQSLATTRQSPPAGAARPRSDPLRAADAPPRTRRPRQPIRALAETLLDQVTASIDPYEDFGSPPPRRCRLFRHACIQPGSTVRWKGSKDTWSGPDRPTDLRADDRSAGCPGATARHAADPVSTHAHRCCQRVRVRHGALRPVLLLRFLFVRWTVR
jgi:hypothetical protein